MRWVRARLNVLAILFLGIAVVGPARSEDEEQLLRTTEMRDLSAQEAHAEWKAIVEGIRSSFAIPLGDLAKHRERTLWENILHGWSASTSISVPLVALDVQDQGEGVQGTRTGSAPALLQTVSYNPLGNWKASVSFFYRLTDEESQPWEGDFIYSFGYSDWRPYTLSLMYTNFGGNKFDPDDGQASSEIEKGSITLGWKFPIHPSIFKPFALTSSSSMGCNVGYSLTPVWAGLNTSGDQWLKHRLAFGCKYTIWKSLFVSVAFNYFPVGDQQQPWDPDFTYGFGWFNWKKGTFSVQYSNVSGNRFPWNRQPAGTGHFKNGSIGVSYSWKI